MKLIDVPIADRPATLHAAYVAPNATIRSVATQFQCTERTVYRHLATHRNGGQAGQKKAARPPSPKPTPTPAPLSSPTVSQILADLAMTRRPNTPDIPPSGNRTCVLDIETSDFSATGLTGFLICAVILPLGSDRPVILAVEDGEQHGDDKRVVADTIQELSKYDNIIGHYVLGFDLPWLYTRADYHNLLPLRGWAILDTYYLARDQRLRTQRKSQAFLLDHFGLENLKTIVYPRLWNDIRSDDTALFRHSRDAIVDHCVKDVVGNRLLFDRIWPKAFATNRCPYRMTPWKGAAIHIESEDAA